YRHGSIVEAQRDSHRARLVGQEANPGAGPPLPVEREEGSLVGQVVEEDRKLPIRTDQADPEVHEAVRRQLRIEREVPLAHWSADRGSAERVEALHVDPAERAGGSGLVQG